MPAPTDAAEPAPGTPHALRALRALRLATLSAVAAHLGAFLWLTRVDRFFACEDDAYRTYTAYLIAHGESIIGYFWLPGQLIAMAAVQRLGAPARWSGLIIGAASVVALVLALAEVARALAPEDLRKAAPWAAVLLAASSPMTLVLGHSSLAEPLECALVVAAAAAVLRRARGGPLWVLALGVLSLLAATWVRYESWGIALALPGVLYLLRRRLGAGPRVALGEAALGALALLGPLAWMWMQAVKYGDPFAFIERADELAALAGEPSSLRVLGHRVGWLLLWGPASVTWAAATLWWLRDRRAATAGGRWFAILASLGIALEIVGGREHATFTARFSYGLEVALWPLAAVGVAWAFTRAPKRALAGAAATLAVLAAGVALPSKIIDTSSVAAGLMLSSGQLDAAIGSGSLLVERPARRPPFGWASLGVLWGHWDRTLWGTPRREGWQLVAPTDVHDVRSGVPPRELGAWLDLHHVTAAWVVSLPSLQNVTAAWPKARVMIIGEGRLVSRE